MRFGEVPPQLKDLTMKEQILIARVNSIISIFKIRGQQTGYSGHIMNFTQHIEQFASRLPHDLHYLNRVVILSRKTPNGLAFFRVRAERVKRALIWLRKNNLHYRDIIIDNLALSSLPSDGDISQLISRTMEDDPRDQAEDRGIEESGFPNMRDGSDIISMNLRRAEGSGSLELGEWPDISPNPINEFDTEGYISKAFPTLFPYGTGDLYASRVHRVTPHQYLMQYKDSRSSNDHRFIYFAYNLLARWDALNCGNVYVRLNQPAGTKCQ